MTQVREDRREQIMNTAGTHLMQRRYATTSVAEIVDAVGTANGTSRHHFPSEEALLEGIVEQQTDTAVCLVAALADSHTPDIVEWVVNHIRLMAAPNNSIYLTDRGTVERLFGPQGSKT